LRSSVCLPLAAQNSVLMMDLLTQLSYRHP
jgi:hypothetical protein